MYCDGEFVCMFELYQLDMKRLLVDKKIIKY